MRNRTQKENRKQSALTILCKTKILFALLLLVPFLNYGQTASTLVDCRSNSCNYDGFSYSVQVSLQLVKTTPRTSTSEENDEDRQYIVTLNNVSAQGDFYYKTKGKTYSQNQLGSICNPNDIAFAKVEVNFGCVDNWSRQEVSFNYVGEQKTINVYFHGNCAQNKNFTLKNSCVLIKAYKEITQRIFQIEDEKSSVNSSGSAAITNPDSSNGSSNSNPGTNSNQPLNNYDPNTGLYGNPPGNSPTPASNDKFTQNMQNANTIINGLAQLLASNEAEQERHEQLELQKKEEKDKTFEKLKSEAESEFTINYLDNFLESAKKGDENSKLILCYAKSFYTYKYCKYTSSNYGIIDLDSKLSDEQCEKWLYGISYNNNPDFAISKAKLFIELEERFRKESASPGGMWPSLNNPSGAILLKAAELGSAEAMFILYDNAINYSRLYNALVNKEKLSYRDFCLKYLTDAAEAGCAKAMEWLAYDYYNGDKYNLYDGKIIKDYKKAYQWYLKSIDINNDSCKTCQLRNEADVYKTLSKMYSKGEGTDKNKQESEKYMKLYKAAKKNE